MKLFKTIFAALAMLLFSNLTNGQAAIQIVGKVVEEESKQPIPYASVYVKVANSEEIIQGATTTDEGDFSIQVDHRDIAVEVSFFGFVTQTFSSPTITNGKVDLGTIALKQDGKTLDDVTVTAERSVVEFSLDKRVFNVGQDLAASGAGAIEVLDNVPSVNVDIEGNISLRGNSGVQILIDGKPSVLSDEGAAALGTLTADMIESVEVITNPSAKYEAEGSSGIINIVLKKDEKKGFNGSVTLNTGIPDNHSVGISLNRRTENFNLFTQIGAGYRSMPNYGESRNYNLVDSTEILSEGIEYRNERFFNITLGTDYHINEYNTLTLSGNFAYEDEDQPSETDFSIYNGTGELVSSYQRAETTTAENPKYQYDLQYEKRFKNNEDHILLFSTQGSFFGKDQRSNFVNTITDGVDLNPNQQTATNFYQRNFIFKVDYTNPLTDAITIETGAQYDINDVGNDYAVYNEGTSGSYVLDSSLSNNFEYNQKVLGVYATGAYEGERWGVKIGARVENTQLNTLLLNTDETNAQNYTNLFPSAHVSYKITEAFSLQAGYSNRIYRPRLWDLNPFFNIRNNYNVRMGNPDLQPEFADSYEITGIWFFDKVSLNSSVYHLYTTDVIERVSFYEDNVNITMPVNIGTRSQLGLELNGKYTPLDWWVITGDFNYGYFARNGSYEEQNFDFTGTQWFTSLSSRFKLPWDLELEVSGDYRSSYKTVQGEQSGFAFADMGIRKKFWKGKAVLNVSVRDIFASRIRESYVYMPTYELYDFSQRGRFFTVGFSYSFGKGEAMSYNGGRRH